MVYDKGRIKTGKDKNPKPGKGDDTRYKIQPVKPDKPKPGRPGINPPRKPGRGIRNPIGKKPGRTLTDQVSDFVKKQRQLPTRVKPEGQRRKKTGPRPSRRNDTRTVPSRLVRPAGSN